MSQIDAVAAGIFAIVIFGRHALAFVFIVHCTLWAHKLGDGHVEAVVVLCTLVEQIAVVRITFECAWTHVYALAGLRLRT